MIDNNTIFVAFDTETTGLSAARGRIVEIAAIKFDLSGSIIGEFEELVDPGMPIPADAMGIHHITDAMVAGKPHVGHVMERFVEFVSDDKAVLIAQNALFDIGFINHEALRHDMTLPKNIILDQIGLTRKAFPGQVSYSLERSCRSLHIVNRQDHRALSDAELVMLLFLRCLNQFASSEEALKVLNGLFRYRFGGPMVTPIDEAMVGIISGAMEKGETIEIVYDGGSLKGRPRLIQPALMFNRDGVSYIVARCLNTNSQKQFRLDRIIECRLATGP